MFDCVQNENEDLPEELEVLAARGARALQDNDTSITYRVTPETAVYFLAKAYRFVYVMDMSPSINSVVSQCLFVVL